MKDEKRVDIYSRVTNHILRAIEHGPGRYRVPWHVSSADSLQPRNVASEQAYRGVNILCLWATAELRGYPSALWGTYKQWHDLGAQVRKGEKAATVVFWKVSEKVVERADPDQEGKTKKVFLARGYSVFNISQVDGYTPPERPKLAEAERVAAAEAYLFGLGADIRHGGSSAFYEPRADYIQMPPYDVFRESRGYYSALAHELTHWTGARGRLDRDLSGRFGDEHYAAEELVAELGAAFTMATLGLSSEPRPDHAAYVANWIPLLKSDPKAIFTAAHKAQRAVDYLYMVHEQLLARKLDATPEQQHEPALEIGR